jgi:hypothetical protein
MDGRGLSKNPNRDPSPHQPKRLAAMTDLHPTRTLTYACLVSMPRYKRIPELKMSPFESGIPQ